MEWLNFRHLYAFWMVAREGSFTGAARAMHVAQSAVSGQVAELESYLEEDLFIRSHRRLDITAAGRELLSYARVIFEQSRQINAALRDKEPSLRHRVLRVGLVGGASRNFAYRLLANYINDTPGAHISVATGSYEELYEQLKKYELELIITLELPKKKDLDELTYRKISNSHMVVVAPKKLISSLKRGTRKKALDLFKFRHPHEVEVIDKYVKPKLRCDVNLRMITDDIPLLRFFANSGDGAVIMPKIGVLEDVEAGHVDFIDLPKCPEVHVYGIFLRGMATEESIEQLLELA